jgi:hypothetical protein
VLVPVPGAWGVRREWATARADQLRDQRSQTTNYWLLAALARLKTSNARRALLFCAFVGMPLANGVANDISAARKCSRHEVGGPAQRLQAGRESGSESG